MSGIDRSVTHADPGMPEWRFCALVARELAVRCWTADDTGLPSRLLLAEPDGKVRAVHVPDEGDDVGRGRYRINHPCLAECAHCVGEPLCRTSAFPPGTLLTGVPPSR
ncbi:hypothetical protein [Nocardiopsis sp. FIRDI 009]|uniref:hypothetical protein n=1 Tax=Nocardiopsis sp. FIRDI 009 TaxID=714197 RepID=UPI000E248C81|nr:hypothetical protein [Nocardiopsis sp. FIRDI 009]